MAEYMLGQKEYDSVTRLPAAERYEHLIKRCADWGAIWSLASDDGWVLTGDGAGHECAPVWPHREYAEACASGSWAGSRPQAIEIHAWIERWLPGLERDGRLVAVFPTPQLTGAVVAPWRMRDDLLAELERIE